ncbi:MAG: glutamate racemase [Candidatus Omnitrophica bacterium]|nr:glutamate racemase [Candidatus Omnitrophota bacterium]MBU1037517.1 glutamate racemase [Candidatus Omnitrophota bacterium]MBU1808243.1 glutamate racemase [Candidatus Omnitrophota bacterium]
MAEILLRGFDIDGIEEVRDDAEITGFSIPVMRNGMPAYKLVYNLQNGYITIQMRDGNSVYVTVERVEFKGLGSSSDAENDAGRRSVSEDGIEVAPNKGSSNRTSTNAMAQIGVFDSGVGGFSAVKEIRRIMPNENILYFADTAYLPYGSKTKDEIRARTNNIITWLASKGVKAIMIPCGTASVSLSGEVKDKLGIPIVNFIDSGVREAVMVTKNKRIGVIGTQLTIRSGAFQTAIRSLEKDALVTAIGCSDAMVDFAERGELVTVEARSMVEKELAGFRDSGIDTLILGCSHYAFLADTIKDVVGDDVTIILPSRTAVLELRSLLEKESLLATQPTRAGPQMLVSGISEDFKYKVKTLLGIEYNVSRADPADAGEIDVSIEHKARRAINFPGALTYAQTQVDGAGVSPSGAITDAEPLDVLISNPIFDTLNSPDSTGLSLIIGKRIREKCLEPLFTIDLSFRQEVLTEVNAMTKEELFTLAKEAINTNRFDDKKRLPQDELTLEDMIYAQTAGSSDDIGSVDLIQYFANAAMIPTNTEMAIEEDDDDWLGKTKLFYRDAYILLRALYYYADQAQTQMIGDVSQRAFELERIHATNFQDMLTYIQAPPQSQGLIIALGTSWIKGYERIEDGKTFRHLQGKDLNGLVTSIRTYCESKGIPFIVDDDDKLLARINAERARAGKAGAKVVVLAGKETVTSDEFATLRNDKKSAFVVGVDSQELTTDSYIRLMEMLTLALKLSIGFEITQDSTSIEIIKDDKLHIYIFIPRAEPMKYEQLKMIYEVQKSA